MRASRIRSFVRYVKATAFEYLCRFDGVTLDAPMPGESTLHAYYFLLRPDANTVGWEVSQGSDGIATHLRPLKVELNLYWRRYT